MALQQLQLAVNVVFVLEALFLWAAGQSLAPPIGWTCNVAPGEAPELYVPDIFTGGPASALGLAINCSYPLDIPTESKVPLWLGATTSAYQDEGAADEGGRNTSIWDTFTAAGGNVTGDVNASVATDFYHRFPQEIQLLKSLGIRNLRVSLSWSRIFSNGTVALNQGGIQFYNNLINMLVDNCIEPHVTLYYNDLPQALQDSYGGWTSYKIVPDFMNYSQTAFTLFGDRVRYWTTINDPAYVCYEGYGTGNAAPGRCSDRNKCKAGNSTTEPGLCAKNILVAHAKAVPLFRKLVPDGIIGINIKMSPFYVPQHNTTEDIDAAERLNSFYYGQFLDPLFAGQWSPGMQAILAPEVLPRFVQNETEALIAAQPLDFIGINYFKGIHVTNDNKSRPLNATATTTDASGAELNGADSGGFAVRPMLRWLDQRYNGTVMTMTENAVEIPGQDSMALNQSLCDAYRVYYLKQVLGNISKAIFEDGIDLQGYFPRLMDDFTWADGYTKRLGIIQVDFTTLRRYYKASSLWLANHFGLSKANSAAHAVNDADALPTKELSPQMVVALGG